MHKSDPPYLSIVSPVYQAEEIVDELVKRIVTVVAKITDDFEIILVEDGSQDQSWERIKTNCEVDARIKGIKLSRNFGQHYAISAGLEQSAGDYVVVMDCDLQDNPEYIPSLIEKSLAGFDIVFTTHEVRKHGKIKNLFAQLFHMTFNWLLSDHNLQSSGQYGAFSLLSRKVVKAYCEFNDYHRHYLSTVRWLGFSKSQIIVEHELRYAGKTSYSVGKLIKLAIDGIISQTEKMLKFSIYTGFCFVLIGLAAIVYIVIESLINGFQPGWASLIVVIVFATGLILSSLGIVSIYIGKIFEQTKRRPLFLVDKTINMEMNK